MSAHHTASRLYGRVSTTTRGLTARWTGTDRGWRAVGLGVGLLVFTFTKVAIPW